MANKRFTAGRSWFSLFTNQTRIEALTLKQPYAGLMFFGKEFETRSWYTNYRGWVLITSSKKDYDIGQISVISGGRHLNRILVMAQDNKDFLKASALKGMAIGVAELYDCKCMFMAQPQEYYDKAFVDYSAGKYIHYYRNAQLIQPFAWKGGLSFQRVSHEQKKQIVFA